MRNYKNYIFILLTIFFGSLLAQENIETKYLLINGEYEEVINILENKLSIKDTLNFSEYFSLGAAYQRKMNFQKAISALNEAKKLEPENIQNLLMLGSCYSSNGNDNYAKFIFTEVLLLDADNQNAKINLGSILLSLDEFEHASKIYESLVKSDSLNAYFYSQLGICNYKVGNIKSAIENFEKSISLHNSSSKVILMLAKLSYDDKDYDKALEVLQYGLTQNSKNKQLNKMLGDVFYKKDKYHEAIIKYLYATTIGDTSANIYQKLGMSYYYLSFTSSFINTEIRTLKLKEGINALNTAVCKDPDDPVSWLYLGLCHKELNEHDTAIKYFEETLNKVFPDYLGEVFYNLGLSYDKVGKYVESIHSYKEALSYKPDKQLINFYLANIYDRYYKDKSVAVLYYQKFVDESIEADENLIGYSLNRIKALSQEAKFWGR
jgi:tetratricopeptide (TPR) repeat protein